MTEPQSLDGLVALGSALQKQEKYAQAAETFAAALGLEPARTDLKKTLLHCLELDARTSVQRGDFRAAAAAYRQIIGIVPRNAGMRMLLGNALYRAGDLEAAEAALAAALETEPDNLQALASAAVVAKALGRPSMTFLARILKSVNDNPKYITMKMWAALESGDPERAFSFDVEGLNVMRWRAFDSLYRQQDLQARLKALPALAGTLPHQTPRPLLYAGGDGNYAARFAQGLIASALEKCPGADFHFHVMNPGAFQPRDAFKDFPKDRLTWTTEAMGPVDKILFAPRRWLRLAQIQYHVERTIILVDTDSIINGDITKALPDDFDIVLYDRSDDPWLHQTINGAFLAVAPTGRDFTDFLAAYILHFEEAGIPKWFDDQFNMVSARAWFTRKVPSLRIRYCSRHMMDWSGSQRPESLIWHAKGHLKEKT